MKPEKHYTTRTGWLRAAVLGANDGIISTASLVIGVAAAGAELSVVLISGIAALVAGSMSMAAGEYVSVSSQADTEKADLKREQKELDENPEFELRELAEIYVDRGLSQSLADQVAAQLMGHDALSAHARDELGISALTQARPAQAAFTSALTFATGSALPLIALMMAPPEHQSIVVASSALVSLGVLGLLAASAGGANRLVGMTRIISWGALAMGLTAVIGKLFDVHA
ncbi:MAG: VIT family protein [Lysobacterales bacterium]